MRDYSVIVPQFWTGDTGKKIKKLGPECQVLALYLVSSPMSNMIGIYYLPIPTLCHETGLPPEGASKGLRSLSEVDFAHYDHEAEIVFVPAMAKWQVGEFMAQKDHRWKAVVRQLLNYKTSRFCAEFINRYQASFELPAIEKLMKLGRGMKGASKGHRSPDNTGAGAGAGTVLLTGAVPPVIDCTSTTTTIAARETNGNGNGNGHLTPVQRAVLLFKRAARVPEEDKEWDKVYFSRYTKPAKDLLTLFGEDIMKVEECVRELVFGFGKKGLTWTPETIVKHAYRVKRARGW